MKVPEKFATAFVSLFYYPSNRNPTYTSIQKSLIKGIL